MCVVIFCLNKCVLNLMLTMEAREEEEKLVADGRSLTWHVSLHQIVAMHTFSHAKARRHYF